MLSELFIPEKVSDADKAKYSRQISNWTYLSTYLSMSHPPYQTIGILLRMELDGRNRQDIVERLSSRLASSMREILKAEVMEEHERITNRKVPV